MSNVGIDNKVGLSGSSTPGDGGVIGFSDDGDDVVGEGADVAATVDEDGFGAVAPPFRREREPPGGIVESCN